MKVRCVFSLESPHPGESNEYTQYTIFNIKKKITLKYPTSVATEFSSKLKSELERAVVNELSVFEPLKFFCKSGNSKETFCLNDRTKWHNNQINHFL